MNRKQQTNKQQTKSVLAFKFSNHTQALQDIDYIHYDLENVRTIT